MDNFSRWGYEAATGEVTIHGAKEFHDYTVSFLAIARFLFKLLQDIRAYRRGIPIPVYILFPCQFIKNQGELMEPFLDEFRSIGLDAVVGSVGNGSTLRLISDIEGVTYTDTRTSLHTFPLPVHQKST